MNLVGMSYKDFVWAHNPTALTVTGERALRESLLPYAGSSLSDLGPKKRKVTGEGYFVGEGCWADWERLWQLYQAGGPGCLRLPGQRPFLAVFDGLRLIGVSGKDLVKYAFSFTEHAQAEAFTGGTVRAAAGESLWDLAWRYGKRVESLRAANPDIRDVASLIQGQEVVIP